MDMINLLHPELSVLVPVLYFIGRGLKKSSWCKDDNIPIVLSALGIVLALFYLLSIHFDSYDYHRVFEIIFAAITQGMLAAGLTTHFHQLFKQKFDAWFLDEINKLKDTTK